MGRHKVVPSSLASSRPPLPSSAAPPHTSRSTSAGTSFWKPAPVRHFSSPLPPTPPHSCCYDAAPRMIPRTMPSTTRLQRTKGPAFLAYHATSSHTQRSVHTWPPHVQGEEEEEEQHPQGVSRRRRAARPSPAPRPSPARGSSGGDGGGSHPQSSVSSADTRMMTTVWSSSPFGEEGEAAKASPEGHADGASMAAMLPPTPAAGLARPPERAIAAVRSADD